MSQSTIKYPAGVEELTTNITSDELYSRLIACLKALSTQSQDEDKYVYVPLAHHLASAFIIHHTNPSIRQVAAFCIGQMFKLFSPLNPYRNPETLQDVLLLIVDQLSGLSSCSSTTRFKESLVLLEDSTSMKIFNFCFILKRTNQIIMPLFKQMFSVVSSVQDTTVNRFTLSMLRSIVVESGVLLPHELLKFLLTRIVEPLKSKSVAAWNLARDLIQEVPPASIHKAFSDSLSGEVELYEVICELRPLMPTLTANIVNSTEMKLMSGSESEQIEVVHLLSKLFSKKNSRWIAENNSLWNLYVTRSRNASTRVRCLILKHTRAVILNHPQESKAALTV